LNVPPNERQPDTEKAELLVKLHKQERLWGPMAGAQMYAAMEYEFAGDMEKARYWAAKARDGLRLWSGQGHEYHARMLQILGEKPEPGEHLYKRLF
jgi:hypothetical protein